MFIYPKLCTAIRASKWKDKALAVLVGVSATTMSRIKNGKATPSLPVFHNLCIELGLDPTDILAEREVIYDDGL